jgi:hypothetical protein
MCAGLCARLNLDANIFKRRRALRVSLRFTPCCAVTKKVLSQVLSKKPEPVALKYHSLNNQAKLPLLKFLPSKLRHPAAFLIICNQGNFTVRFQLSVINKCNISSVLQHHFNHIIHSIADKMIIIFFNILCNE